MTDRRRHEAIEGARRRREVRVRALGLAQRLGVSNGGLDMRPHRFEQHPVVRVAIDFLHQENELSRTVVLGYGIGAALVDAAGHLAALELVRRIPPQIVRGDVRVAEPKERFGDHRAVTDPGARVGPRPGAEHGAVARDEQMRQRRSHRIDQRPRLQPERAERRD